MIKLKENRNNKNNAENFNQKFLANFPHTKVSRQ